MKKCPECGASYVHPAVWAGGTTPAPTPGCDCSRRPELMTLGPVNRPAAHLQAGEPAEGDSDADET